MLSSIIIATLLYCIVSEVLSFSPPSVAKKANHKLQTYHILCSSDIDDFDPFLHSPHDMGDDNDTSKDNLESSSAFGFVSYATEEEDTTVTAIPQTSNDGEFDPLLSPHDYINGADEAPVSNTNDARNISNRPFVSSSVSSSSFGFDIVKEDDSISIKIESSESVSNTQININDDEFDPLLSPHAYANGVNEAPVNLDSTASTQEKIGILLIDHGSKRSVSNEHIMNVARMYEKRMAVKEQATLSSTSSKIVRAAHMEIAPPSILDSIRNLIVDDKVSKVICVPYFLSPGKHAMEDVPQLIDEAKLILSEEGLVNDGGDNILVSHALGTHMEGMLSVVDDLVESALL